MGGVGGTLPKTNIFAPENRPKRQKERIVFQPSIFRCKLAVSFRDGNPWIPMDRFHLTSPPRAMPYRGQAQTFGVADGRSTQCHLEQVMASQKSWEPKGTPPMPRPPGNKALIRPYLLRETNG